MPVPPRLEYVDASVRLGGALVLDGISLGIPAGAFVALTGASGAGKTTLLRLANRLLAVDSGLVRIDGADVAAADPPALRRGIGYAIQGVGLFPHWTIAENIAAVPRLLGNDAATMAARVRILLDMVELPQDFAGRFPRELSGGQASRVGLARALAAQPKLLLLDEPFGALDPETRASLADKLVELHRGQQLTIVMVTHDLADALTRADRIVVLDGGRIAADGPPAAMVRSAHPAVQALVASPVAQARRIGELLA